MVTSKRLHITTPLLVDTQRVILGQNIGTLKTQTADLELYLACRWLIPTLDVFSGVKCGQKAIETSPSACLCHLQLLTHSALSLNE